MKLNQKLFVFSAPSGSGKTTIANKTVDTNSLLEFCISATNRSIRGTEKEGVDYYFLTAEEFQQKITNEEFAEWEEVYPGKFYGTLKSEINLINIYFNGNEKTIFLNRGIAFSSPIKRP